MPACVALIDHRCHVGVIRANAGLYIKLGQHISSLNHILPAPYTETLKVLQNQAPRTEWPMVQQTILEELGAPIDELFSSFDTTPLAAASIAQV